MTTLADTMRPALVRTLAGTSPAARVLADAALILAGSALIALAAQIALPLPFSPVPVTGQTFAVLLVGSALGRRRGAAAAAAYLVEGVLGLPVFAGGLAGPAILAGPTGGYLLGFIAGAWVCGALAERGWDRTPGATILSMVLGNAVIFAAGLAWLSRYTGGERVWELGFLPFLPGDFVKIALAAATLPLVWQGVRRAHPEGYRPADSVSCADPKDRP